MLKSLTSQVYLKQYITYSFTFIAYGLFYVSLGPIIPFLAEKANINQTQYSFLFNCRVYGAIITFFILKFIHSLKIHPPSHKIIGVSAIFIILFNLLFAWSKSFFFQGLWTIIATVSYLILEILIQVSIIVFNENIQGQFLLISGCFGIGSALSPIIIGSVGVQLAFYIFSFILGLTVPAYFLLPSPKIINHSKQNTQKSDKSISKRVEILLGVAFCLNLGIMITKLGWSSSYAVISEISTKEEATIYPFLFSFFSMVFKFVWMFVPYATNVKLKFCLPIVAIIQCISTIIAKMGYIKESLYFNNVLLGIFMSPLITLIFSLSKSYNVPLNDKQASGIAMAGVFGQVIMATVCGQLMKRISIDMYYYFVIFLTISLWVVGSYVMNLLETQTAPKLSIEIQLLQKISSQTQQKE